MKLALVIICAAKDNEAPMLRRCLTHFAPLVDKVFITITGENKACEDVAKAFDAHITHTEWKKDFAKARNFALFQVPKEYDYWMWADTDDVIRGGEKLRETIESNPGVDAFIFNYLYAFDKWGNPVVVHMKTRVLRNDGCVDWRGKLHEDLHNWRALEAKFVDGIEYLHLTDEERIEESKKRNVEVAEAGQQADPNDPRTYWNLGNALKANGQNQESIDAFNKFLASSLSEEEKYIVHLRMSEIYADMKDDVKALDHVRMAIGLRPLYPDAHIASARIFMRTKRLHEAKDAVIHALQLPPPYHKVIVYNPRDYDLEPLKLLASIYLQLSLPQLALVALKSCFEITPKDEDLAALIEKLEVEAKRANEVVELVSKLKDIEDTDVLRAELEKVDPEYLSHPALSHLRNTRLIKTESSGKDIVFFCGVTEHLWTPETARKQGIGGSEEAVIHLSKQFADAGYNVTVYNNCGHKRQVFDGVQYCPYWEWNYRDKQDVVIVWRSPRPLDYGINAEKVFVDMHDVVDAGEFNDSRIGKMTKAFFKSKCHRELYPQIPDEKTCVVPNGIVWEAFQKGLPRDPNLVINTSSPDRSLKTLLKAFKRVKERVPAAKLKWAYGWQIWDSMFSGDTERLAWKKEVEDLAASTPGVELLGRLGHEAVADLYQQAGVFGYPTAFFEIDCISARKAQAAGAVPIATDFAALNETIQYGVKVKTDVEKENWGRPREFDFGLQEEAAIDKWVDATVEALENPKTEQELREMRDWTKKFDWSNVASTWLKMIE